MNAEGSHPTGATINIEELREGAAKSGGNVDDVNLKVGDVDTAARILLLTPEELAELFEKNGFVKQAATVRKKMVEEGILAKVKRGMKRQITVEHVIYAAGVAVAATIIWEGVRYVFRNKVDLPGFVRYDREVIEINPRGGGNATTPRGTQNPARA